MIVTGPVYPSPAAPLSSAANLQSARPLCAELRTSAVWETSPHACPMYPVGQPKRTFSPLLRLCGRVSGLQRSGAGEAEGTSEP